MKEKTKPRAKRKKTRITADDVRYTVEITSWNWDFFFSVSKNTLKGAPYEDYRHLVVSGNFLAPEKLAGKPIEVTFLPDVKLNKGDAPLFPIRSAGHLTLPRSAYAICHMPMDALPSVLQMLSVQMFRYLMLAAEPPRYGKASIVSYRFSAQAE